MWRILLLKRHKKNCDFKEGVDTDHIRDWPGKVICSGGEYFGLPHLDKASETFKKAQAGG